ncbi:MAG: hypothetical protein WBD07_09790 [Vicinamibacterales bacterium]
MAITVSAVVPVYAQRGGKPVAPPKASGQANHAPKPAPRSAAAKPAKTDIGQRIATKPQLSAKLQALLPPNITLDEAAAGFKNQGQFIAALHVSHNLEIPFDLLKASMTGPEPKSLGQSVKALRPTVDAEAAVSRAEREAMEDEKVVAQ